MKKIIFAAAIILIIGSFSSIQLPSARAEEAKTFVGTIESWKPVMGRPPKWPNAIIWCVSEKGDKIKIWILGASGASPTAVTDFDGKQIDKPGYNHRPQVGKKVEVKYSIGEDGRNEAMSMRYVPVDYLPQTVISTEQSGLNPAPSVTAASEARNIILVGKVLKGGVTFSLRCPYRFVIVTDNGEKKDIWIPRDVINITDVNGKVVIGAPPRAGKRMEVRYSIGDNGQYEAVSMRYIPDDYVPQAVSAAVPVQTVQVMPAQTKNVFVGKITKIIPFRLLQVTPDNGGTPMYFKVSDETVIFDIHGEPVPNDSKSLIVGSRIEGKYARIIGVGFSGAKTVEAVSIRYVPADYTQQPAAQTNMAITPQATVQSGNTFVGTIKAFPFGPMQFKSGPPLWPFGMIKVMADSGEQNNFLIVGSGPRAAVFYDVDGKNLGPARSAKIVKIGKKVEVTYTTPPETARYANRNLAVSIRYVPADYVPQAQALPASTASTAHTEITPQAAAQPASTYVGQIFVIADLSLQTPGTWRITVTEESARHVLLTGKRIYLLVNGQTIITDIDGKRLSNTSESLRKHARVEVKYTGETAISLHYVPTDYVSQSVQAVSTVTPTQDKK